MSTHDKPDNLEYQLPVDKSYDLVADRDCIVFSTRTQCIKWDHQTGVNLPFDLLQKFAEQCLELTQAVATGEEQPAAEVLPEEVPLPAPVSSVRRRPKPGDGTYRMVSASLGDPLKALSVG